MIKEIISDRNVVVFAGGKNWFDTSIIRDFYKSGENLLEQDFEEDQAFFTTKTELEIRETMKKVEEENLKNKDNEDYEMLDIISELNLIGFSFNSCEKIWEDE